jgi:protein-tyrosine phosphatase
MKVLFVCLGNICRSPLGEGILQHKINQQGLDWETDSAGTAAYHVGEKPDKRSAAIAKEHDIDINVQRARQFVKSDFNTFDHILVMDDSNFNNVMLLAASSQEEAKVEKLLDYGNATIKDVPDPYYEGGFDGVFNLIEQAIDDFIAKH